jgi:hypothetical protein
MAVDGIGSQQRWISSISPMVPKASWAPTADPVLFQPVEEVALLLRPMSRSITAQRLDPPARYPPEHVREAFLSRMEAQISRHDLVCGKASGHAEEDGGGAGGVCIPAVARIVDHSRYDTRVDVLAGRVVRCRSSDRLGFMAKVSTARAASLRPGPEPRRWRPGCPPHRWCWFEPDLLWFPLSSTFKLAEVPSGEAH